MNNGLNKNDWIAAAISFACLAGSIAATVFSHIAMTQRINEYNNSLKLPPTHHT